MLRYTRQFQTPNPSAQGCVSSPVLFTIYTNECVSKNPHNDIVKSSDDTAILSLLYRDQDTASYHSEIKQFVDWCDAHHLVVVTISSVQIQVGASDQYSF